MEEGTVRIRALRCGSIRVPERVPHGPGLAGLGLFAPESRRVTLPCAAYLIEHPRHGRILVDCGWPREISPDGVYDAAAVRRILPRGVANFYRPVVAGGETIDERLAALGLRAEDIDVVLLTHLDPDHVAAVGKLRGAKRLLMSEEEYFWSCRTVFSLCQPKSLWRDMGIRTFWVHGGSWGPRGRHCDLYGDGSVLLVLLPGPSMGQFAVMLFHGARYVLLTADGAYSPRNWREGVLPGYGFDADAQKKALDWIRSCSEDENCVAILASHDPDAVGRVIEF